MGAILNTLPLSETDNLQRISPNRADWLTSHADATGLAVVEVERLWNRFKQITGSNDQPAFDPANNALPSELSNDVFVKNFLKHFPRSKTDGNSIPFGYFLVVMHWLDEANVQNKLVAIFLYLNNGAPITAPMISKLLVFIYPETKPDEIKAISIQFMRELGSNEHGEINQQQFVTGVQRTIPPHELDALLHFDIIPSQLLEESKKLPSLQSSSVNMFSTTNDFRDDNQMNGNALISDDELRQIANQAARKDWSKFALTLGFLEYDIEAYKVRNNQDAASTIFELLQIWREQEASLATKNRLRYCLRQSGLDELVSILH